MSIDVRNNSSEPRREWSSSLIGRNEEMRHFSAWLSQAEAPTQLWSVSGIGGIGKTTMLIEMATLARTSSAVVLWLDGKTDTLLPSSFLSNLEMVLQTEYGIHRDDATPLMAHVLQQLSGTRTVLIVDNFEYIDLVEEWLLSSFLPRIANREVLLVFGNRSGLPIKWRTNPHWQRRLKTWQLGMFAREEVRQYLRPFGASEEQVEMVLRKTDGHPLAVALAVESLQHDDGIQAFAEQIPHVISREMLREVTSSSLQAALQVLCMFQIANLAALEPFLDALPAPTLYQELSKLSFVRTTSAGIAVHDVIGRMLREDLRQRDPNAFYALRYRVMKTLAEQFVSAHQQGQIRITAHILNLYREHLPTEHEYAKFSLAPQARPYQPFHADDLPALHRMISLSVVQANWQSELVSPERYHDLLDEIALACPEGIFIVRDQTGQPLAFTAGLWLHEKTVPLINNYAPLLLQDALREEEHAIRRLPHEWMDSMCVLLALVDIEHRTYNPFELAALLFQAWFSHITVGARGIVVSGDAVLNSLLNQYGFRQRQHLRSSNASMSALTVWEIDFRNAKFSAWIEDILVQMDPAKRRSGETSLISAQAVPATTAITQTGSLKATAQVVAATVACPATDMENTLKHFYDIQFLETTCWVKQRGISGIDLRRQIESMLTEHPARHPLSKIEQEILFEMYLRKEETRSSLAERLNMSRATFYRHAQRALLHLHQVLVNLAE
ncbi:MAG: hypothetical protein A2201_08800 [Alicyclobacillus sp. RIFOXYA1_FULL_53_8]|nr:MAG: hypothetical protein A2201_08800 [Alicyclobacillus sp. RIFOXYA1_FULL_53_8]